MSHSNDNSANITYDPLPGNDHPPDIPYNAPLPEPPSLSYDTPQLGSRDSIQDPDIPPPVGAPRPRFFGQELYSEGGGGPHIQQSYTDLHGASPAASLYTGSVYALNDRPFDSQVYDRAYRDDPYFIDDQGAVPLSPVGRDRYLSEKHATYARPFTFGKRRVLMWVAAIVVLIILSVGLPVYFVVIRPKHDASAASSSSTPAAKPSSTSRPSSSSAITGGDGSTVTMDDGTTFIYSNPFGGYWYWDPNDPFNNGAKAQSWSPALNETFNYGSDRIWGFVNLIK
jgi:glucan 1,3-beta-glucosidase